MRGLAIAAVGTAVAVAGASSPAPASWARSVRSAAPASSVSPASAADAVRGTVVPGGLGTASGIGPAAALRPSAVFNVPSGSAAEQNAIAHHVNQLTAGAPRGALIRIAVFMFTSQAFARTLTDAKRRGAHVQLVVDASTRDNDAYRRVERALGTSRKRSSWVVACHKGCVGDTIMHNKFFLFSRTGRARNVVVQSSANLTTRNRVNAWNNAFTISDARLYRAYGRYFSALAARHHERDHYRVTRSGPVTAYTFPRAGDSATTDTLYRLLGKVGCGGGTSVHVTTFNLSRTDVAERLWSLSHQGCDVRVIYTNLSDRAREILEQEDGPELLSSHYMYFDAETGDEVDAFAHSKYVLIDGTYAGRSRKVVITGSPNYTEPALRHNDETMISIEGAGVYGAYENNFTRLWDAAQSHYQLKGSVPDPG
ncbi:phospholipase D-like domain-containing protein [Actinoallomurus rhizosphaericola]|uniref:phospholipase D-like domain-containing protein n=1 Tax=Actinoallomurus rhizosphaericola TaxID=2952536 RepID=UPI0020910537|nr:phospholipase D-like domain-containing protein [Actinoallomurus rhizosphaericola]MCO5993045.1 phospholipase D-like domain-containing protein [Actinoallomurus rhizosphaericola]